MMWAPMSASSVLLSEGADIKAESFSVEPVKDAFDRLKQIAAADGNWEAIRCAIAAGEGQLRINVSRNSQFSSAKRLAAMAASIDPNSEFVGASTCDFHRLDSLFKNSGPSLIKIDTQGFEREVLAGARLRYPAPLAS